MQCVAFSRSRYPNIRRHYVAAVGKGWPRVLIVNRPRADERRDRLLDETDLPPRAGFDRDEYPSAENRSHGSSLGAKLRRFCNGTRFRYVFR